MIDHERSSIFPNFDSPVARTTCEYARVVIVVNDPVHGHIVCILINLHVDTAVGCVTFINCSLFSPDEKNVRVFGMKGEACSTSYGLEMDFR